MYVNSISIFIEITYVLIFDQKINFQRYSFFLLFDIIQIIDNFVILKTPFLRDGIMVNSVNDIINHYGKFLFFLHVFASLPLSWIAVLKQNYWLYLILSINRIFRIPQVYNSYHLITESTMYSGTSSRLIPLIVSFFAIIHIFAFIFYLVAKIEGIKSSWISSYSDWTPFRQYIASIYFVMTTVLTIGFGDIHPITTIESIICIIIELISVVYFAAVIARVVSILNDPYGDKYVVKYAKLNDYLKFQHVDNEDILLVQNYFQYRWDVTHGAPNWDELTKDLPDSIKSAIKLELCKKAFSASSIFKGLNQRYILMMMDTMEAVNYIPGEVIFMQGDMSFDLYIFKTGIIETIIDGSSIGVTTAEKPFVDGERALFFDEPRAKTLRAVSFVDGWRLKKDHFLSLLKSSRNLRMKIFNNAKEKFPADLNLAGTLNNSIKHSVINDSFALNSSESE